MRILNHGQRFSDRVILRTVAETLGIPETEAAGLNKTASDHTAACANCPCEDGMTCKKCACHTSASTEHTAEMGCPECETKMYRTLDESMNRCASCGYAEAVQKPDTVVNQKTAADTSLLEYYKQIFPDDYAKELTADTAPKTPAAGKKVEYGTVKGASLRVTGSEVLAAS